MHTIIETPTYLRHAKEAGASDEERFEIVAAIARNPMQGDLIPGTGGARKVRYQRPGMGKRGGYRVITYYAADDVPVFLLGLVSKSQRVNLSKSERDESRKYLSGIAQSYRKTVRKKAS